tara:strand:+ start:140 stop:598 length:459 start_codon:yes stop_codon:yes gene_type:complete
MKKCPTCKIKKESKFFTKDKTKKDGLYAICKACRMRRRKERYEKDYETMKEKMKNMTGGIYIIKNEKENKIYVGQSIMIEQRKKQHFTDLRGKRHPNKQLQEDFNRLGEDAFDHQVYQEVVKDDVLLIKLKELETMFKFRNEGWKLYNSEEK